VKKYLRPAVVTLLPVLGLSLLLLAGCGGGTTASKGSPPSAVSIQNLGVPAYPGTKPSEAYSGVFKMTTADSFEAVVEFYKKQLPKATFSQIAIDTGKGASFVLDDADFHGNVSVEENMPTKGQVTITVSKFSTK